MGLDREMKVKYFLQEFMVDPENKMGNFKMVEKEIHDFFTEFKQCQDKNEETSTFFSERLSVDTVMLPSRLVVDSDRKSW